MGGPATAARCVCVARMADDVGTSTVISGVVQRAVSGEVGVESAFACLVGWLSGQEEGKLASRCEMHIARCYPIPARVHVSESEWFPPSCRQWIWERGDWLFASGPVPSMASE